MWRNRARSVPSWSARLATAGLPVREPAELFAIAQSLFEARVNTLDRSSPDFPDAMQALQAEERRTAIAVVACDEAFGSSRLAIAAELEAPLVAENRALFEDVRRELALIDERLRTFEATWPPEDLE